MKVLFVNGLPTIFVTKQSCDVSCFFSLKALSHIKYNLPTFIFRYTSPKWPNGPSVTVPDLKQWYSLRLYGACQK